MWVQFDSLLYDWVESHELIKLKTLKFISFVVVQYRCIIKENHDEGMFPSLIWNKEEQFSDKPLICTYQITEKTLWQELHLGQRPKYIKFENL
jgi:hypothetical protein